MEPLKLERTIETVKFNYLKVLADLKISSKNNNSKTFKNIGGFGSISNIPRNFKKPKIVVTCSLFFKYIPMKINNNPKL